MTGPVGRVPLTDEQLDEWARGAVGADRVTGGCLWWPSAVSSLVAELRASRAREQDALDDAEDMRQHFLTANGAAQENARQMWAARAERDALAAELSVLRPALREAKRRIDKALSECQQREPRTCLQQFAHLASHSATLIPTAVVRAALTGTETTQDAK